MKYQNGDVYKGTWEDDQWCKGTLTKKDDYNYTHVYTGDFIDMKREGYGEYTKYKTNSEGKTIEISSYKGYWK